jgi:hypothetical protein
LRLDDFLQRHCISLHEIAARAQDVLKLDEGDVLVVCGSIVEGVGNLHSDLDFYLITERTDFHYSYVDSLLFFVGSCPCDVQVLRQGALERTLEAFAKWSGLPRNPRTAMFLSEEERRVLCRLQGGVPIFGALRWQRLRERIPRQTLARHKLDWARCHAGTLQVDLAGMRKEGDWPSMILATQDLVCHAADALLAASNLLAPAPKWRVKLLHELGPLWESTLPGVPSGRGAVDRFLSIHRAPEHVTPPAVLAHALRGVAYSRSILAWAEMRILSGEELPARTPIAAEAVNDSPILLPALDLDIDVRWQEGRFDLFRLNTSPAAYQLSAKAYDVLMLFNGTTQRGTAIRHALRLDNESGVDVLDDLHGLIRNAAFIADGAFDNAALEALLNSRLN